MSEMGKRGGEGLALSFKKALSPLPHLEMCTQRDITANAPRRGRDRVSEDIMIMDKQAGLDYIHAPYPPPEPALFGRFLFLFC